MTTGDRSDYLTGKPTLLEVDMLRKLTLIAASSFFAACFALAAYAEDQQNAPQSPPAGHQGMMENGGMPMMNMMQQMSRMMENCNRMMESHMQQQPAPAPPEPEKKG